jgi:hypothetical protein
MSSAATETERRAVDKAYALRDALVAARRFWTYGRYANVTRRVSAGVVGALHGAGRFFFVTLEEVPERLVGPPAVVFDGRWWVERKEGARLLVRAAVTTEGYARFAQTYEECVRVQARLDVMQVRWENAQLLFAWTAADREDIRVLFAELRRLWAPVLAQVQEIKGLLDMLMQVQVERRRLTSKLALPRPALKPRADGQGVQQLLDALVNCAEV